MNDKRQGFKKIEMLWSRVRPPFLHMGRNILDDLLTWINMHQEAIYIYISLYRLVETRNNTVHLIMVLQCES